jgi:hypothetical protein
VEKEVTNTLRLGTEVVPQEIFDGSFTFLQEDPAAQAVVDYAVSIVEMSFDKSIDDIVLTDQSQLESFVPAATTAKQGFTNNSYTLNLIRDLIAARYDSKYLNDIVFDPPRLRIIPNSNILSAGISYNYKPHRDTWYAGVQEQINHWMPVHNVGPESTMYMIPKYFHEPVPNNSEVYDLDLWDKTFRNKASENVKQEERPHPVPLVDIPERDKVYLTMPVGTEIAFSGHHFHGSGVNNTNKVRFSVDYRVVINQEGFIYPKNIDDFSVGDLKRFMVPFNKSDVQ